MKKFSAALLVVVLAVLSFTAFSACWQDKYETEKPSLSSNDGWRLTYSDEFKDFSSLEEVYEKTAWSPVEHGPRRSGYWCDETIELDTQEGALVVRSFTANDHECDVCPEEDLSVIMDSNGMFEKLWQFSAFMVSKGFKIIGVGNEEKFDEGDMPKAERDTVHIILRACKSGIPNKENNRITIARKNYTIIYHK